jgi:hypothetical protein
MISIIEASALRRKPVLLGYTPIPTFGKTPAQERWQETANVTTEMLRMWSLTWPSACNTGVLTKFCPTIDIDIFNEEAARACEEFIRDRFEDAGYVLTRIGQAPKRAIPFHTEEPFSKITKNFVGDRGEKIEMLASGQQVVVHGDHPDTRQPYRWHGGEPWTIPYDDLPYLHAEQARELVADVVKILTTEFRYQRATSSGLRNGNGRDEPRVTGEDRWRTLIDNILHGRALHDTFRDLAAMLAASGMSSGAAVHLLQALGEQVEPYDARVETRLRDIPRAIDTAYRKFR